MIHEFFWELFRWKSRSNPKAADQEVKWRSAGEWNALKMAKVKKEFLFSLIIDYLPDFQKQHYQRRADCAEYYLLVNFVRLITSSLNTLV